MRELILSPKYIATILNRIILNDSEAIRFLALADTIKPYKHITLYNKRYFRMFRVKRVWGVNLIVEKGAIGLYTGYLQKEVSFMINKMDKATRNKFIYEDGHFGTFYNFNDILLPKVLSERLLILSNMIKRLGFTDNEINILKRNIPNSKKKYIENVYSREDNRYYIELFFVILYELVFYYLENNEFFNGFDININSLTKS